MQVQMILKSRQAYNRKTENELIGLLQESKLL